MFTCYYASMSVYILITGFLAGISSLLYIISILRGKNKPQRITRFVVFGTILLGTFALYANHDWPTFWLNVVYCVSNLLIFLLSIKYGMGGWAKTDIACLVISGIGILIWQITSEPLLALFASIFANIIGNIPALLKTYKFPKTETWIYYFLGIFANGIILFAQKSFSFGKYVFPIYIVLLNTTFLFLILRGVILKTIKK